MSLSIRQKLAAWLGAILALFIAATGYEIVELNGELNEMQRAETAIDRAFDKVVPLNLLVKDVRFHVVQVQQWLTDISATRGQDGLNDGFDVAKEHRAAFEAAAAQAKSMAADLGLKDIVSAIEASAGTQDVSSNIQGVTAAVTETTEVSHTISAAASELSTQAGSLRKSVDAFLTEVRGG